MKTLTAIRIVSAIALVATTAFQGWMGARYRSLAVGLRDQAVAQNSQAKELARQMDEYKSLPAPAAELMRQGLELVGYTNVSCVVWGAKGEKMFGFLVETDGVTPLPGLHIQMRTVESEDASAKKKL